MTCANLIKKYGDNPQTLNKESTNSSYTGEMNEILNYKLREYILQLSKEKKQK